MQVSEGLVSVIVPFYNSRRFLPETIESVLAQTYPHWELLLVDDGSSDGSADIVRDYAKRHAGRIAYFEHPGHANYGAARTRNLGASRSHGEFLAFLDSDDIWLPDKLAEQIALMRAHPEVGLVYAPSVYWYDWDPDLPAERRQNHMPPLAPSGRVYESPFLLIHTYPLGKWGAPGPSSWLVRRSTFDEVGGFAEEFKRLFEDIAFLSKVYLSGRKVLISETCSDHYRCHDASVWHQAVGTKEEERDLKFYFQWLRRFLKERRVKDQAVWKAVRRAGWMYWWPLPPPCC